MLYSIIPFFRKRVEALLAGPSIEEWKIKILSKDLDDCKYNTFKEMEDWKYQMLLQADEEEKALCIESQRSRTMCELLLKAEESWRLNALSEAANAGFWLAHLVSRYLCYRLISYKMNSLFIFLP